jgi:hypothetical protein
MAIHRDKWESEREPGRLFDTEEEATKHDLLLATAAEIDAYIAAISADSSARSKAERRNWLVKWETYKLVGFEGADSE